MLIDLSDYTVDEDWCIPYSRRWHPYITPRIIYVQDHTSMILYAATGY